MPSIDPTQYAAGLFVTPKPEAAIADGSFAFSALLDSLAGDSTTAASAATKPVPAGNEGEDGAVVLDTSQGPIALNLEDYFTAQPGGNLLDVPLILPNRGSVEALLRHATRVFADLMQANGITDLPSEVRFDDQGHLQLPDDFPYADEVRSFLADNPALERELQSLLAIASHVVAMDRASGAGSGADQAATTAGTLRDGLDRLFAGRRDDTQVALRFLDDGRATLAPVAG